MKMSIQPSWTRTVSWGVAGIFCVTQAMPLSYANELLRSSPMGKSQSNLASSAFEGAIVAWGQGPRQANPLELYGRDNLKQLGALFKNTEWGIQLPLAGPRAQGVATLRERIKDRQISLYGTNIILCVF